MFQPREKVYFSSNEQRSYCRSALVLFPQYRASDVILYNVASQKGQKFTLEQTFKSLNKTLIDGVLHEVLFTADFFNVRPDGAA